MTQSPSMFFPLPPFLKGGLFGGGLGCSFLGRIMVSTKELANE